MTALDSYNQLLGAWDFDAERPGRFVDILSRRNAVILAMTAPTDFRATRARRARNVAHVDGRRLRHPRFTAFHVAAPHQRRLHAFLSEGTGAPWNRGVFFSLDERDVVFHLDLEKDPMEMVYFLDAYDASDVRVQTCYRSSVLSRWDTEPLFGEHVALTARQRRRAHLRLNRAWIEANTARYEPSRRAGSRDWLIVPDPIRVVDR